AARWPIGLGALLVLALALPALGASPAQPSTAAPTELTTNDLRGLVGTLENDAERQKLIAELKALIAAHSQAAGGQPEAAASEVATPSTAGTDSTGALLIAGISERLRQISMSLTNAAAALGDFPSILDWGRRQVTDPERRLAWLEVCGKLVLVLGIALL